MHINIIYLEKSVYRYGNIPADFTQFYSILMI